jgi:hypothetical protein
VVIRTCAARLASSSRQNSTMLTPNFGSISACHCPNTPAQWRYPHQNTETQPERDDIPEPEEERQRGHHADDHGHETGRGVRNR